MGNGNGTFQTPLDFPTPGLPFLLVTADVNGDGKLDLVVELRTVGFTTGAVFLGNGDGTFRPFGKPGGCGFFTSGDFNGDGQLDLGIGLGGANFDSLCLFLGNGDGTFRSNVTATSTTDTNSEPLAVGDFNGDGRLDMVASSFTSGPTVFPQAPIASLSPRDGLVFPVQAIGTKRTKTASLQNISGGVLTVSNVITTGEDFSQTNNCNVPIQVGGHCSIFVTFRPTAVGKRTGTLTVFDNSTTSPHVIRLTGAGS